MLVQQQQHGKERRQRQQQRNIVVVVVVQHGESTLVMCRLRCDVYTFEISADAYPPLTLFSPHPPWLIRCSFSLSFVVCVRACVSVCVCAFCIIFMLAAFTLRPSYPPTPLALYHYQRSYAANPYTISLFYISRSSRLVMCVCIICITTA